MKETKRTRVLRVLITIEVIEDDNPQTTPSDEAQASLTDFEPIEAPHGPSRAQVALDPTPTPTEATDGLQAGGNWPTYADGRRLHPRGPDRAEHPSYADGRKTHTCRICQAPRRRYNSKTGMCGEGINCRPEYAGVHPAFRGVE